MSSLQVPPRFVPTLTEMVHAAPLPGAGVVKANEASAACSRPESAMVQAVLQRLELILERRVQEAVAQLVLDHTQSFATRLREEIPQVVRQCMLRAIKEESAQAQLPHDSTQTVFLD